MKCRKAGIQPAVVSLSMVVAILAIAAGLLGYNYSLAENQVSNLRDSGQTYCSAVNSVIPKVAGTLENVSQSLQTQIQADQSVIASLNASKPAGYEGIVTTLNGQITQDSAMIAEISSYSSLSPPVSYTFCYLAVGPSPIS